MSHYVKNADLLREIIISKENKQLTPTAILYINKMIEGCARVMRYKDIEDKHDCMSFAMLDVLLYWNGFKPEKSSNAFSWFTQVIKNGLAKGWKKLHPIKSTQKISISETNGIYNI